MKPIPAGMLYRRYKRHQETEKRERETYDHQGMRLYRMDCWTRTIKSQKGQGKKAIRMMGRERKIRDNTKEKRDQHPRKAKQNEANKET